MPITAEMIIVLVIMLFTILMIIAEVARVDAIAVTVLVMLGVSQILPTSLLFSGFSSDAVISLIAVMILSKGLEKTGIMAIVVKYLTNIGGTKRKTVTALLCMITGLLAGFVRSLGAIALFLPVVNRIALRCNISKSYLMMPMAFCAIMGGTITLIGTGPLILLNSLIEDANIHLPKGITPLENYHLFSVLPIGLILLATGTLFFVFLSKYFLPNHEDKIPTGAKMSYFQKTYDVGGDIFEIVVNKNSEMIGLSLVAFENKLPLSAAIVGLIQGNKEYMPALRKTKIDAGDKLAIISTKEVIDDFASKNNLTVRTKLKNFSEMINPSRCGLAEAVIPPNSTLVGQAMKDIHVKRNFGLQVLSLIRGDNIFRGSDLRKVVIRSGDTLGLWSSWEQLTDLDNRRDFVLVTSVYPKGKANKDKIIPAIIFFVLTIALIVTGKIPFSVVLLLGACGMIFTKIITIDEAYSAVSWQTVFLLGGLIPLGIAMQKSGVTDLISTSLYNYSQNLSLISVEILLSIVTTLIALVMSNVGATIIMVPLAIALGQKLGANPSAFALLTAIAASNTFILPTHQANALVAGPGGYSVRDFIKVGSVISILYLLVSITAINLWF